MPLTPDYREAVLNAFFNDVTTGAFPTDYVGLATGHPGDGYTPANESTVTGRVIGPSASETNSTVTPWERRATSQVIFGAASGSGVMTHWFMNNNATPGTSFTGFYEQFPSPVNLGIGDQFRWEAYRLSLRVTNVFCSTTILMDLLNAILVDQAWNPAITNRYFGLSSTTPTILGGNFTEPVGNNYARKLYSTFTIGTSASVSFAQNTSAITFNTASGDWTGLTHWGLFNALTGGTPYMIGALDSTVTVLSGQTPSFLAGDLRVEMPAL